MTKEQKPLHEDMNAMRWAVEFSNKYTVWSDEGVESDPKGLMVGWFANAIMAGFDEASRGYERLNQQTKRECVGLTPAQCDALWKVGMTPFEYYQAIEAKLKE